MVCEKCQAKLTKLACPDTWKEDSKTTGAAAKAAGAAAASGVASATGPVKKQTSRAVVKAGGPVSRPCRICKTGIDAQHHYCQPCAYKKGICTMCGRKTLDTSSYVMSAR